ncbi:MAG: hypothetical protein IJX46_06050 [Clostridia bacterium]|nr:hypothetical protein [Clostridia bacterium]
MQLHVDVIVLIIFRFKASIARKPNPTHVKKSLNGILTKFDRPYPRNAKIHAVRNSASANERDPTVPLEGISAITDAVFINNELFGKDQGAESDYRKANGNGEKDRRKYLFWALIFGLGYDPERQKSHHKSR